MNTGKKKDKSEEVRWKKTVLPLPLHCKVRLLGLLADFSKKQTLLMKNTCRGALYEMLCLFFTITECASACIWSYKDFVKYIDASLYHNFVNK